MIKSVRRIVQAHHKNCLSNIRFNYSVKSNPGLKLSYVSSTSTQPLIIDTIGQKLEQASELYPNRDAYVFTQTNKRLSFEDLRIKAENLATSLLGIGIEKGDRVAIWAPNCIEWIITQYATALIGVVQVNINPAYQVHELEYALNKVGCKALIMSETYKTQNYVDIFLHCCPEINSAVPGCLNAKRVPNLKNVILISEKHKKGFFSFEDLSKGRDNSQNTKLDNLKKIIQSSDPINIQYTSGTTGSPKGVVLSHHMILNNANQVTFAQDYHKNRTIICLLAPLYHCMGMVLASLSTICHGITCVIPSPTFNPEASLQAIQKEKCTSLYGTPTMFIDMYSHPNFKNYDTSSLNSGIMAGSTCPVEIVQKCIKFLNTKNIVVVYGLTETSPVITLNTIQDSLINRTQTIGRVLDHVEVKVVDQNGIIVPIGEIGELLVRGHNTMIGYYGDRDKTDEVYTSDRFFKTGDLVRLNSEGYFTFVGRLKDIVIRGGENIYPREIEEFLHNHPKIADVYVIGLPDQRFGEELCACIRLKDGQQLTSEELKAYCKGKISYFKIPRYIEFMNDFPMTVSGKIQKNILKEKISKKLGLA